MTLRSTVRQTLDQLGLLSPVRRYRKRFHVLLDRFSLPKPDWCRYVFPDSQPYASNFTSRWGYTKLKECIDFFMPSRLTHARILDIGAADGCGMTILKQKYPESCEVYGLNMNRFEVSDARKIRKLQMRRGDMHCIPFAKDFFDIVFWNDGFEHSIAPYIALCEINRVLKCDGLGILINPSKQDDLKIPYHFSVFERWQMEIFLYKCYFLIDKIEEYRGLDNSRYDVYFCRKWGNSNPNSPRAYPGIQEEH